MGATIRRFGGNITSRYNWETGAWNTGLDWFWEIAGLGADADHVVTRRSSRQRAAAALLLFGNIHDRRAECLQRLDAGGGTAITSPIAEQRRWHIHQR